MYRCRKVKGTNLVAGGVAQTGEHGGELAGKRGIGILLEDNLLEVGRSNDLEELQSATNCGA